MHEVYHTQFNILVHDVINWLYYEYWPDKQKYFYVYENSNWQDRATSSLVTKEHIYIYIYIYK